MKVIQLLPTMGMGDAIGNDVLALSKVLRDMGFQTGIYAETVDRRLPEGTAQTVDKMPRFSGEDVILYHKSTGTDLSFSLEQYACRKLMIFHNITPPRYFKGYNDTLTEISEYGMRGLCHLADKVDYCMADSAYNASVLRELNYRCPIVVRPILIPFSDYAKTPDPEVMAHYENDGYTNFVFVGRIAPNKKQEDVIRAFYCYKKYCNPKSRLFLVGSYTGMERYYHRLRRYVGALELDNVVFTGHIPFAQILAYYHLADLFLCMSEHEGFCVPLVEAMYFGIPILAYDSSAISDTLGGSGVLLQSNDPMEAALMADRVIRNRDLRREIVAGQRRRQQDFAYGEIRKLFEQQIREFLEKVPPCAKKKSRKRK
ncbi:glycosyltransferase family 4 protein [Ruminococcus sp.]|uniref:glycosyltransferase family 4 protein n=1 Tax=Ruminococcus sp. TaxID=41978 RepID=UPI0025F2E7BD|nr:glycosyltransferase family 4 protein [Ruminococcus sp.]